MVATVNFRIDYFNLITRNLWFSSVLVTIYQVVLLTQGAWHFLITGHNFPSYPNVELCCWLMINPGSPIWKYCRLTWTQFCHMSILHSSLTMVVLDYVCLTPLAAIIMWISAGWHRPAIRHVWQYILYIKYNCIHCHGLESILKLW